MSAVTNLADYRQQHQKTEQPEKRMQDGFVAIPNAVEDALLASTITHRQERVYRAILRKTLGFGKASDCIATSQISSMTGFDESDVRKTLNDIMDMGMITRGRRSKFGTETTPVLTPNLWNLKQGNSPRLAPQTGRITPNKQGELPPTIDNSTDNKPTTPCIPQSGKQETTLTAKPRKSSSAKTFRKWSEELKSAGEELITTVDPIFTYAADAGIPVEFLRLAWVEFRDRYNAEDKRYSDWRNVFRKSVRECWMKLWYLDSGEYKLTSKGQQAMAVMQKRESQS